MSTSMPLTIQLSGSQGKTGCYEDALHRLGACPLPGYCPLPDLSCDGLLLCGGGDLESTLFGQENRGSNPPDVDRDRAELALFQESLEKFTRYAVRERRKIRAGRMLLKVGWIRRMRDRRKFPMKAADIGM